MFLSRNETDEKDDDLTTKRSLQSQVVATSWEAKQRNQVLEEQKNDTKSLNRNKRMFGLILGTLEKFKSEESQRKDTVFIVFFFEKNTKLLIHLFTLEKRRD